MSILVGMSIVKYYCMFCPFLGMSVVNYFFMQVYIVRYDCYEALQYAMTILLGMSL